MLATRAILLFTALLACQPAFAQSPEQIELGRQLFFEETFEGNGRTCGTCHPATNNFTIDPAFVRALPRNDPLFIIRSTRSCGIWRSGGSCARERSWRTSTGLPTGVMRGVPHTLALRRSTQNGATGWSGDGSPGALREFATGAVIQHFPKTLNRVPGVDFRLPTAEELDAMLAFQLSLGRQQDIDLATLPPFADATVEGRSVPECAGAGWHHPRVYCVSRNGGAMIATSTPGSPSCRTRRPVGWRPAEGSRRWRARALPSA